MSVEAAYTLISETGRLLFEAAMKRTGPPWLRRTEGGRLMETFGSQLDKLVDRSMQSVKLRFPGFEPDALPLLGRDRRIRRGPGESDETYATRLRSWWDDHRARGGPYALLRQLHAYWLATLNVRMDVVYHSGTRRWIDADGVITRDSVEWNADGSNQWSQYWLFFYLGADPAGLVTDGAVEDETSDDFRAVPADWTAAHILRVTIVLLYGTARLWGYPQPVTTWGAWTWQGPTTNPVLILVE